jgi:hypothetical protein
MGTCFYAQMLNTFQQAHPYAFLAHREVVKKNAMQGQQIAIGGTELAEMCLTAVGASGKQGKTDELQM